MLRNPDFTGEYFGYARVSTVDQDLRLQRDALIAAGVPEAHIFEDHKSGRTMNRAGLKRVMKLMRPGDCLVVWRLDRIGRNTRGLLGVTEELEKHDIQLVSLKEDIDTTTAGGKLMVTMLAEMAQFESDVNAERTRAGMAAARERGSKHGRENYILSQPPMLKKFTQLWLAGNIPDGDIGARRLIKFMNEEVGRSGRKYKAPASYTNWKNQKFPGLRAKWEEAAKGKGELADLARQALDMPNVKKTTETVL